MTEPVGRTVWPTHEQAALPIGLHRDADRDPDAWVSPIVHIVAVAPVINVDVVVVVPVVRPVFRPRVEERNPVPLVLEARVSSIDHEGKSVDPKPMLRPKVTAIPIGRNSIAVITAALLP